MKYNLPSQQIAVKALSFTQRQLAEHYGCSVDTIRNRLKSVNFSAQKDLFIIDKNTAELNYKSDALIVNDFVCNSITETGNIDDGILIVKSIWKTEELIGAEFPTQSIGCLKQFKVGKIFLLKDLGEGIPEVPMGHWSFLPVETVYKLAQKTAKEYIYLITDVFINLSDGENHWTTMNTNKNFDKIRELILSGDYESAIELLDIKSGIKSSEAGKNGEIEIIDDKLYYNGKQLNGTLVKKIIAKMQEGSKFDDLMLFLENLVKNPSKIAVNRLYDFLKANDIELTDDGHFYAWKRVRGDFKDIYSGQFDNSPGQIVQMDRSDVDDDDERTCSNGLHVCSASYLKHYGTTSGNKTVKVKVNPADVVSIPVDYNNAKMRVCRYEVLEEVYEPTE